MMAGSVIDQQCIASVSKPCSIKWKKPCRHHYICAVHKIRPGAAGSGAESVGGAGAKGGAESVGGAGAKGGAESIGGAGAKGGAELVGVAGAKGGAESIGGAGAKGGAESIGGAGAKGGAEELIRYRVAGASQAKRTDYFYNLPSVVM